MLGEHPLDDPPDVGDGRNELPQARRAHRDQEFGPFPVTLDPDFDLDRRSHDRGPPNEFCFHIAPRKTLAYARTGEMCQKPFPPGTEVR